MSEDIKIPGYEILEKLGAGSAGSVYKARQLSMDRLVAVKILPPKFASDKAFIERFYSEARAVARLNHPHIVTGIDVGCADGIYYFVMEYVDGETAAHKLIGKGPYKEAEALALTRQVALALDHAFKNGIVHRDVKPANILMTRDGVAKLADLGVASLASNPSALGSGAVIGTPYYMSPEAAKGEDDVDIRADIYSLGATLYHLLVGKPPFHGNPINAVMAKQVTEEPAPLREVRPDISKRVEALVAQMMQKDRDKRFSSPNELVGAIDRAATGETGHHPKHRRTAKPASPAPSRMKLALGFGGTLAALLAVVVLLTLAGGSGDKPPLRPEPSAAQVSVAAVSPQSAAAPAPAAAPSAQAEAPSPEDEARKELDRLAEVQGSLPDRIKAHEDFLAKYPGLEVSKAAKVRLEALRCDLAEAEEFEQIAARSEQIIIEAQRLIEIGQLANAWNLPRAEQAEWPRGKAVIERTISQIELLCRDEIGRVGQRALDLARNGRAVEARREIRSLDVEGAPELDRLAQGALAAVDGALEEIRLRELDQQLHRALALYEALVAAVDPLIMQQDLDGAEEEIRRALAREELSPAENLLREDLRLVDQIRTGLREVSRGAERLRGEAHAFNLRDGTRMSGTVKGTSARSVEVESRIGSGRSAGAFSVRVDFSKLSREEVVSLHARGASAPANEAALRLALVFHVFGDAEAAEGRIVAAGEAGVDIQPAVRRFGLGRRSEVEAEGLLTEARAAYAAGDFARTAEIIRRLQSDYSNTEAYRKNYRTGTERGWVVMETWRDVPGVRINRLLQSEKFPDSPDERSILTALEAPQNRGDNFGARIRGFFLPPVSGAYVFSISGDNEVELHLSSDASAEGKRRIAHVPTHSAHRTWDAHASQRSEPVELVAGRRYYFELLHKEATGDDHFSVMATFPDGSTALPLGGRHIAPYEPD